jgi:hypothetical protein
MPGQLAGADLAGVAEEVFLERLCAIHDAVLEIRAEAARKRQDEGS